MDKSDFPDDLPELQLMQIQTERNPTVYRPPLPVDQIYQMDRIMSKPVAVDAVDTPTEKTKPRKGSIFFRLGGRGIEDDPFLKRLSRLN